METGILVNLHLFNFQKAMIPTKFILSVSVPVLLLVMSDLTTAIGDRTETTTTSIQTKAKFSDEPYLVKTFQLSGNGTLNVKTSGGSIEVSGQKTNEVRVEMYVKSSSAWSFFGSDDDEEVEEKLKEDYEINISQTGNAVNATAERKSRDWGSNGLSISFKVIVPEEISSNLNTSGGSITLTQVEGQQSIKTSGGSLNIANVTGDLEGKTSGGSINIDNFNGTLQAQTSGGSIKLENSEGDLSVGTSGGSIRLYNISGSIDARTSGGSINAEINEIGDMLSLKTSGGSIHAVIPNGLGLDLDLRGNRVNTSLSDFSGTSKNNEVRGTVNGGGIPVSMHTSGGSVTLDYKGQASVN